MDQESHDCHQDSRLRRSRLVLTVPAETAEFAMLHLQYAD
jgi:hypothetical protein